MNDQTAVGADVGQDVKNTVRSGWRAEMLALLAGAALPLAFAPMGLYPLAVLSPLVLFALWLGAAPRAAFRRGFAYGLGMFGVGVSWVYVAVHVFGETPAPVAALLTGGFVALLALFPATLGYTLAHLFQGWDAGRPRPAHGLKLLLVLPAAWVLWEWVRGWFFTGFSWLALGYSQIDAPLAGLAPVLGVYGVSWAVALTAAAVLYVLRLALPARRTGRLERAHSNALLAGVVAVALLWGGAGLAGRVDWTRPAGEPLGVALVQGNIPQEIKWDPEQFAYTQALYATLTREQHGKDLVVWPENAIPAFYHWLADNYFADLEQRLQAAGTDLLLGLPVLDLDTDRYYNSLLSLGSQRAFYHKQRLVPFGEYVPLEQMLRGAIGFLDLPMSSFSPGPAGPPLLTAAGHALGVTICYEDTFGEQVIRALPEAALLVNVSNNAWYGNSLAPHQHLEISRMRARETGRDLLRATTNGISAIIDHRGEVVGRSPQFRTHVLEGSAQPREGATPYVRLGNYPVLAGIALVLLPFAYLAWRRRAA